MRTALVALLVVACYSPPRPEWTDAPAPSDAPTWERCDGCAPACSGTDPNVAQCVTELGELCPAECVPRCTYADGTVNPATAYCDAAGGMPRCDGAGNADGCFRAL